MLAMWSVTVKESTPKTSLKRKIKAGELHAMSREEVQELWVKQY